MRSNHPDVAIDDAMWAEHPIHRLDLATLDYVIESLVGILVVKPDLTLEAAIANVRAIRAITDGSQAHTNHVDPEKVSG